MSVPANANARRAMGRCEGLVSKEKHNPQDESTLQRKLDLLRIVQRPFDAVFWFLEQKITRISDELERRKA
jgi:hypothetical protein